MGSLVFLILGIAVGVALGWKLRGRSSEPAPLGTADAEQRATADRERQLLRIVEALPLGVMVFDESGDEIFTNGEAALLTRDRLRAALVRSTVAEVVAEAAAGRIAQKMLELHGSPRSYLSIRGVPVGAAVEGGTVGDGTAGEAAVVVTIEDSTDVRSADLLRRDFVANVSHELKTPVGAISVLAETLIDVDDPETAKRLAGRLQHESYRLATTVDDLLTLARIESGEHTQADDLRMADLLLAVTGRVAFQVEEKSITLDVSSEPDGLVLSGDRVQLTSGLGNLVDNAVKYSEAGSTITVRATSTDEDITITVADEGIGIPEADRDRIFERFYRVDRGRSRETGGTGLGLAIARHVLLNHGGSIDVESEEGVGTTFVLTLPRERQGAEAEHLAAPPATEGPN